MTKRELDIQVGEHVFGWEVSVYENYQGIEGTSYVCREKVQGNHWSLPHFSECMTAAWTVAEKLVSDGYDFDFDNFSASGADWSLCLWTEEKEIYATDPSAPRTICLAALKAVGAEVCAE